jgi:ribonuclease J
VRELAPDAQIDLGPFSIRYVRMAHSIPEANALAIRVEGVGTLVHTGDWKIDHAPVVGWKTDEAFLKELGNEGVLAVLGDSTNAMVPGHSGSEGAIAANLADIFSEFRRNIVVTCFSTNVARLHGIHEAARKNGRQVCLVGRSLWAADDAARSSGYLKDVPPFLDIDAAGLLPPGKVVFVCTGSQGETRAALSRISQGEHRDISLGEGDAVIFSSRAIPGNDRAIDRIKNRFHASGVAVITDRDAAIHVSGHPYRDELKQLYSWLKPKVAIPVHGEQMQQEKHAQLARECGVPETIVAVNGRVLEISKDGARAVGEVPSGILALEGRRIVAFDHEAILTRRRMMFHGSAIVTVVIDAQGRLVADPRITALGLLDENNDDDAAVLAKISSEIARMVRDMPKEERLSDAEISEAVRVAARRFFNDLFDRKPQTRVHLVRI